MMIHDAAGSIVVVSAESVKMAGEGCIVLTPAPCTSIIRR